MRSGQYVRSLCEFYYAHSNAGAAASAKAYMRGQFDYFGMSTPGRRSASKLFLEKHGSPSCAQLTAVAKLLWKQPFRECQYFAMEMLEKRTGELKEKDIALFEYMITTRSWWDTIDFISPKLLGPFFGHNRGLIYPKTKAWMRSGNIWLMRSALLFQMKYRKETDEKLLFALISACMHEKEFFIRKAIGWALSEHSKTFPASVKRFIKSNKETLSALSKKEGLRQFQ
jgi:3-methyladenine DNA glycosylase AlkD